MGAEKRWYTHSSSAAFRTCMYKYYVQYVLGYRAKKMAPPLKFGIMMHCALEAYWKARKAGHQNPLLPALEALWKGIDPFEYARARVMMVAYAAVWGQVTCEVITVEAKFVMPLVHPDTLSPSDRFDRAGKIDLIIRLPDGRVVLVEHKTSAMDIGPGSDYQRRLSLDEQITFYWAGAISLGYRPSFVIYDVLKKFREEPREATPVDKRVYVVDRKTKLKRIKSGQREAAETVEEYEKRLTAVVVKYPEKYIERISITRLPHERKRFALDVWNQSRLMVHAIDNQLFPRNSDACFRYGGACSVWQHCGENVPLNDLSVFKQSAEFHPELTDAPVPSTEGT